MISVAFAVSKGSVGKSLLTANVGTAAAARSKTVVLAQEVEQTIADHS